MTSGRWSRTLFRALLRLYPRSFYESYGRDLEADFDALIEARGVRAAWARVAGDLVPSLRVSHRTAREGRRHVSRLTLGHLAPGGLMFDIRHALRSLARTPTFTFVAVGTLALGIGANSAVFSLVNAALIRPLGYADPDRLMVLYEVFPDTAARRWVFSASDFDDVMRLQSSFSELGAYRIRPFELSGLGAPEEVRAAQVTGSVFALLGIAPAFGRVIGPDNATDPRIVVLSHGFWQRRFGGRQALGERITLSRLPYTIVGVMPEGFEFPKRGPAVNSEPADVWMPLVFGAVERQARGSFFQNTVIGRLRDGVTVERAAADMAAIGAQVRANYPVQLKQFAALLSIEAVPLADDVAGEVRRPLMVLLAAVALVLLIACANIANLILSRAVAREREIGVRIALGAARGRLFQMLLAESLVLGLSAGGLGLLMAHLIVQALPAVITTGMPGVSAVVLDGRVVAFALALALVTSVGFGLVPVIASGRRTLNDVLREGGASIGSARRHRLQGVLVVASVALAFVLLASAGLLTRSLTRLLAADTGVRTDGVLSVRVTLPFPSYNNAAATRGFYRNLTERLGALPGVRAAAIATDVPLVGDGERRSFTPDNMDTAGISPSVAVTWIHGAYFEALGIPIVSGRTFSAEEQEQNRRTAIVSQGLATRYWPGESAVGKRLRWGVAQSVPEAPTWMTVVGVVGDVSDGPPGDPIMHVYVPYGEVVDQVFSGPIVSAMYRGMTVAVRAGHDGDSAPGPVLAAIASLDPALAVTDVRTLGEIAADRTAPQRFSTFVLGGFAVGALFLAAVGLYGVLAFGVAQRTREIGVRLALGAGPGSVIGLVMRRGLVLVGLGLLAGGAAALASVRVMSTLLYETGIYDPLTFAAVPVVLGAVALVASYLPARRAARVDPLITLRAE